MKKRILLLFFILGCAPIGDLKKGGTSEYLVGLVIGNWRSISSGTGTGTGTIGLNTSVTGEYLVVRELTQTSLIKRGIDSKQSILQNYTIIDIYSYGNPKQFGGFDSLNISGNQASNYFISDAIALVLLKDPITINSTTTNFIKIKSDLTVERAADGYIRYFDIIKNGIFVWDDSNSYTINQQNNSKTLIINSNPVPVLENSNNDLIFQNGSVLRFGSNSLTSIVAADSLWYNHQGNFSVFRSGSTSITKIYDTITLNNYTVQQCGPSITALSSKFAHVNDCQDNPILDMTSGVRSGVNKIGFSRFIWNSATILVSDGGLGIGQSCGLNLSYGICHIDVSTKNLTKIISSSVSPASTSSGKTILLSTKNYFFFIGEKSNGAIVSGKYDVITGSSVEFNISGTPVRIQGF